VDRLQQIDCRKNGWVIEGFPQSLSQCAALEEAGLKPTKFGVLKLSEATLTDRCTTRRVDPETGIKYHAVAEGGEGEPSDEAVKGRLIQSPTDIPGEEAGLLEKRVKVFNEQMNDLVDHWKDLLKSIDAERPAERVFDDLQRMAESNPWQMIMLGAPASGKGRLIESFINLFDLVHLTVPLIVKALKTTSEVGQRAFQAMLDDQPVTDDDICQLVVERIKMPDCVKKGWMLDGFPKNKETAQLLVSKGLKAQKLVLVECTLETALERQIHRRRDKKTGKVYDLKTNPPPDNATLVQRPGDNPERVTELYNKYCSETEGIDKAFGNKVALVDGNGTDEKLFEDTLDALHSDS